MRQAPRHSTPRSQPPGRLAALLASVLLLATSPVARSADVPAGTVITGSVSGATSGLLGLDSGFNPGPGSHITALSAADLEYLSDDYAVGIDFFADGLVRVYDNTGTGTITGVYSFVFSFAALPETFTGFALADTSELSAGQVSVSRINDSTLGLTLNNAAFTTTFGSFTAQAVTAPVPEPASWALAAAGLALLAGLASRQQRRAGEPA